MGYGNDSINILLYRTENLDYQQFQKLRNEECNIAENIPNSSILLIPENEFIGFERDMGVKCNNRCHTPSNSGDVMKRAIYLANWFLGQYAYVCSKCDTDTLDSKIVKLWQIIQKKGDCTANEAYKANKSAFKNAKEVGELMVKLIEMEKVLKIPTHKGIKVTPN